MRTLKATKTSKTVSTLLLILSLCLLVNSYANAQCTSHDPREKRKDLYLDLLRPKPRHRWRYPTMTFHVQNTAKYIYGSDITFAKNLWE